MSLSPTEPRGQLSALIVGWFNSPESLMKLQNGAISQMRIAVVVKTIRTVSVVNSILT